MNRRPTNRFLTLLSVAASVGAVAAPAALAVKSDAVDRAAPARTDARSDALRLRSEAMNRLYAPAATLYSTAQLRALEARSEAMNGQFAADPSDSVGPIGRRDGVPDGYQPQLHTGVVGAQSSDAIDWNDVAIGVGGGFALTLILGGVAVSTRNRRSRFAHS